MKKNITEYRIDYKMNMLSENELDKNPYKQFKLWFEEVCKSDIIEPNAMILSTIDSNNYPNSRVVLLKGIEKNGLVFYSNYNSSKGKELELNSNAYLLFYWPNLERQVRIRGNINKISSKLSDKYFFSRPKKSQISAIISEQSQKINDKNILKDRIKEIEKNNYTIKRPSYWGGYKLIPNYYEFWQGRPSRLHDRFIYEKKLNKWNIHRLQP